MSSSLASACASQAAEAPITAKQKQQKPMQPKARKKHSYRQHKPKSTGTAMNEIINSDFWGHLSKSGVADFARYKVHASRCDCNKVKVLYSGDERRISLYDGLVVLPDAKRPQFAYVCCETRFDSKASFARNRSAYETKLCAEIFRSNALNKGVTTGKCTESNDKAHKQIKISCAQCLLKFEPNGFVCVSSTSLSTMLFVRDIARENSKRKKEAGLTLHADHADYVCIVSVKALLNMSKARTRRETVAASLGLTYELTCNNGISVDVISRNVNRKHIKIEFGHHLKSLLYIVSNYEYQDMHWFVLVNCMEDEVDFALDLPGGKRHLGENSFNCAVRETEEESSLIIDKSWIQTTEQSAKDKGNLYFMLTPPEELLTQSVDEVTDRFSRLRTL